MADNRSVSTTASNITLSGGNATNPLSWGYLVNHADLTSGIDYVTDSDFPNIIRILKSVKITSGYFKEDTYSASFSDRRGFDFAATVTHVEFTGNTFVRVNSNVTMRASATSVWIVDGWGIQIYPTTASGEIIISMSIESANATSSYVRNMLIYAANRTQIGVNVNFQYGFPSDGDYIIRTHDVNLVPNTSGSTAQITIEGSSSSSTFNGNPYLIDNVVNSGSNIFDRLTFVSTEVDAQRDEYRVQSVNNRIILVDPTVKMGLAENDGTYSLFNAALTTLEIRRRCLVRVRGLAEVVIGQVRVRIFNGTHLFHAGFNSLLTASDGQTQFTLAGVYQVTSGGTVTDRSSINIRARHFGYYPVEDVMTAKPNVNLEHYITMIRDPAIPDIGINAATSFSGDTTIDIDFENGSIAVDGNTVRDAAFMYQKYHYLLDNNVNMDNVNYFNGIVGFYEFDTGTDDAWPININDDFYTDDRENIGQVLKSNGVITLASTAGCNILLDYMDGANHYSSMLFELIHGVQIGDVADFDDLKFNLRYKRTIETTADGETTSADSYVSLFSNSAPINRPGTRAELLLTFQTSRSDEAGMTVTDRELNLTIMLPTTYLRALNYNIDEFQLTVQQINFDSIPGFVGMTADTIESTYNTLIATGTWALDLTGELHVLTLDNVGNISIHDIAVFLQRHLLVNANIFTTLEAHPFTYSGNHLVYTNLNIVVNGNSSIRDVTRLLTVHTVTGTNIANQNFTGTVRFEIVNEDITGFKMSIINTADNSVLLDFTDFVGRAAVYNNFDNLNCRAVIYAEGYQPRTVNFSTNTNAFIDIILDSEPEIDYTRDIGVMNINATNSIVSLHRVTAPIDVSMLELGNRTFLELRIEPTSSDDITVIQDDTLTFFGLVKGHNDFLAYARDFDVLDILLIEADHIVGNNTHFNMRLVSSSSNVGSYVHLTINIVSGFTGFNSFNSNNKRIYFESIREVCDSDEIIESIREGTNCATLEQIRQIFF